MRFEGTDVRLWGAIGKSAAGLSSRKYDFIQENVKDIVEHLEDTILKSGKRVRIYPLKATNSFGYRGNYEQQHLPIDGYFDIDLRNPNSKEYKKSMDILNHIANVLHAHPDAFVVKKYNSDYDYSDGKMIFAFNLNGYLNIDEIYSAFSGRKGKHFPINTILHEFEDPNNPMNKINFYDLVDEYNKKWDNLWSHHIGYSLSHGGNSEWHNIYLAGVKEARTAALAAGLDHFAIGLYL